MMTLTWFGSFKRLAISVLVLGGIALAQNPNLDTNIKGSRLPCSRPDTGTADHYVVTCNLGPILRTGSEIKFIAVNANTGASDLDVSGSGAIALKKWAAGALVDLVAGDIPAGAAVDAWYDGPGTEFQVLIFGGSPANVGSSFSAIRTCFITTGDPDSSSPVLVDGNDAPAQCSNDFGFDLTIKGVACWADAGSPTVNPILTAGSGASILSSALTCGTASWAAGTVNGSPVLHSFSTGGATCSSTPCTLDGNITTAGGTARYLIIKVDFQ